MGDYVLRAEKSTKENELCWYYTHLLLLSRNALSPISTQANTRMDSLSRFIRIGICALSVYMDVLC